MQFGIYLGRNRDFSNLRVVRLVHHYPEGPVNGRPAWDIEPAIVGGPVCDLFLIPVNGTSPQDLCGAILTHLRRRPLSGDFLTTVFRHGILVRDVDGDVICGMRSSDLGNEVSLQCFDCNEEVFVQAEGISLRQVRQRVLELLAPEPIGVSEI